MNAVKVHFSLSSVWFQCCCITHASFTTRAWAEPISATATAKKRIGHVHPHWPKLFEFFSSSFFLHLLWFYSCLPSSPPPLLSLAQSLSDCNRDPSDTFSFNPPHPHWSLTVHHLKAPLRLRTIYPGGGQRHWEELVQGRQVSGCNCRTDDKRPGRAGWTQRLMVIACPGDFAEGRSSWRSGDRTVTWFTSIITIDGWDTMSPELLATYSTSKWIISSASRCSIVCIFQNVFSIHLKKKKKEWSEAKRNHYWPAKLSYSCPKQRNIQPYFAQKSLNVMLSKPFGDLAHMTQRSHRGIWNKNKGDWFTNLPIGAAKHHNVQRNSD